MLSLFRVRRKQLLSWGLEVAVLNRVGDYFWDRRPKVSMAASIFSPWIPTDTLITFAEASPLTFPSISSR